MTYRWYDLSKEEVLSILHSDDEKGLTRAEAAARLKEDGKNVINPVQKAPIRAYLLQVVSDLTALLMLAFSLPAFIFRRDMSILLMLALLLVNYTITVFSYIRAQKSLERLGYAAQPTAKVMREGKVRVIDAESVVQGDILYLSPGDVVPCDARILEAEGLRVLEGNLFDGERPSIKDASFARSGLFKPSETLNMVYASTVVLSGRSRAVAVATGPDALVCKLKKNRPIAACHRLDVITDLKKISSLLSVILLLPAFFLTLIEMFRGGSPAEVFISALAVAVAAMPEMYAAFAYAAVSGGMRAALGKKEKRGTFIKNPLALPVLAELDCLLLPIESLGLERFSTVSEIFDGDGFCDLSKNAPNERALRVLRYGIISTGRYGAVRMIAMNEQNENIYTREQEALIEAGTRCKIYGKDLDERYPILEHREKGENGSLFETTLIRYRNQDVVVLRGEPEEVLKRCSGYCRKGRIYPMDAYAAGELLSMAHSQIKNNRKAVAVATKNSAYNNLLRIVDCQSDLIFEGFLFVEKPLLPEAAKQIVRLHKEGIRVMAYSAQESEENRYLAYSLGIAREKEQRIRASELVSTSEEIFRINLKNYTFFEGFSTAQLRFAVETLGSEYGLKIGMMGRRMEDFTPMRFAAVGFSEEEGRQLGRVPAKGEEVYTPFFSKKSAEGTDMGCQALNYVSHVILPRADLSGQGGINAMTVALRSARWIYRNIGVLLSYLAFSGGLRFVALLFGMGAQRMLSPVQTLFSGLIIDLAAVFVIISDRCEGDFAPFHRNSVLSRTILNLLPFVGVGGLLSAVTCFAGTLLLKAGALSDMGFRSFCFVEFFLLQAVFLTALLRTGRPVGRNFRLSFSYRIFLVGALLFFVLCFAIPPFGTMFSVCAVGWKAIVSLFVPPLFLAVGAVLWRFLHSGSHKRKNVSEKNSEEKHSETNGKD